jgi:hypothetical protein
VRGSDQTVGSGQVPGERRVGERLVDRRGHRSRVQR